MVQPWSPEPGMSASRETLALESLFPHSVSFDHFEPEMYENFGEDTDTLVSSDGALARFGEHIPLVSSGIQLLHELAGNQEALERARKSDPLGRDGILVHSLEYVPVINSIMQTVHQAGEDDESLQRARERDPIGRHGYVTKALEHIPLVSDGIVAIHRHSGDDVAAERARGYSLQKLFGPDGAVTRAAELVPGLNFLPAGFHWMNGDRERASRAIDLPRSWGSASDPDSALWQMAELVPGADAVAFAVHLQGGYYAQALRSVTKTSWVNVRTEELILCIRCGSLSQLWCSKVDILHVDVIPRQFSLVVGLSDLATNFLEIDREGQRRHIKDPEASGEETQRTAMALSKELVKGVVDEILALRIDYFTRNVPTYADWIVEFLNGYLLPKYREESTAWQLFSPREFPALSDEEKQEGQAAFPSITVQHRSLDAPEPIRLKPRRMPVASTSCWSFAAVAGLCGLTKVGFGACAAGCLAGAAQLGHSAVRTVIDSIGHGNARRWQSAVVAPQPAQTPAASSGALQGLSSSDSGTLPKESPKETPTEKGSDDTAECTGTTGTTLPGHGTVLELPSEAVERLSPYLCDYLLRAVTLNQKSSWRRALWRLLGRRWLLSAVHSAMKDPLPLVLALDLDPWEVKLDGYSFNLKMPSMRFAVVLQVEVSSIGCSFVRAFAAFPDELVVNLVRCLQEQMQGWDLREMDPRFAGFTQPARVGFDLEVDWPSSSEIRLTAKKLNSRLDLSAS